MKRILPHSQPFVGKEEREACARVIAGRQLSQNGEAALLEKELAAVVGHRFGAVVSSGTAALYLALRAMDISNKDSVIIPSYVCTALINAVNFTGAKPVLADVDPVTGNITPASVRAALRKNVRAVIVPHLFGRPADAAGIARLGIPVIEDCAQCVGAEVNGRPVGGLSTVSIFSFYATKLIGAGEGGMVASSSRRIVDRIIALREYDNRAVYVPSFNFKLSDLHAAIARVQIKKLSGMVEKRRALAGRYRDLLAPLHPAIQVPLPPEDGVSPVYFRFVVRAVSASLRDKIIKNMDTAGIACRRPIFRPIHRYLGMEGFPGSDLMYNQAISLPMYPDLNFADVDRIVRCLKKTVEK